MQSAVIVLVNVVVIWLMTAKMGVANQPGDIGKIVGITMMMILYIWILITTTNKITPITITDVTMLRLFSDILKMTAKGFMFFMRVFSKPYLADITKA